MKSLAQLQRIKNLGIIAILRAPCGDRIVEAAEALYAGGVDVIEITFSVPNAHRVLEQVAVKLGDHILLGAGSVLDSETARIAMLSGAEFIVTPTLRQPVIETCRRYDKPCIPGAMTPTEVLTAWEMGASMVKVFPCDSLGPRHIRTIRAPLPQIPLVPTGGVCLENAVEFLAAGATALGVGGSIAPSDAILYGDTDRIENLARRFRETVFESRVFV